MRPDTLAAAICTPGRMAAGIWAALLLLVPHQAVAVVPGDSLRISVVTMGAGEAVWERFGHNAIMVENVATGDARWYNYGMFSFAAADFWPRFLSGRMHYWMEGRDARWELENYVAANRSVWVQELDLDPAQRAAMRDFLAWNAQPENRFYEYNYFLDNCSTRVRDAVDRITGGALRAATASLPSGTTYRFHVRRLTSASPFVYTGVEFGLGRPADRITSRWEEMWLPFALREHLRTVRLTDGSGHSRPLVRSERELFASTREAPPLLPPRAWPLYLLAGIAGGAAFIRLGERVDMSTPARRAMIVGGIAWATLSALAGLVLTALQFTAHTGAHSNANLFQFPVLSLALLALIPLGIRNRPRFGAPLAITAASVAAAAVLGLVLEALPAGFQYNIEAAGLALPIHIGLAVATWRLSQQAAGPGAPATRR